MCEVDSTSPPVQIKSASLLLARFDPAEAVATVDAGVEARLGAVDAASGAGQQGVAAGRLGQRPPASTGPAVSAPPGSSSCRIPPPIPAPHVQRQGGRS